MEVYTECQAINLNLKQTIRTPGNCTTQSFWKKGVWILYGDGNGKSKVLIDELGMLLARGEVNLLSS